MLKRVSVVVALMVMGLISFVAVAQAMVPEPGELLHVVGIIEEVTESSVTIGDDVVLISAETETLGDIIEGATAQALASEDSEGVLTALFITTYFEQPEEDDDEYEYIYVEGEVSELTENTLTVDDVTFELTEDTELYGEPEVGLLVKVKGKQTDGESIIALRVRVLDELDLPDLVEIEGAIDALTETSLEIDGITVDIISDTYIRGELEIGSDAHVLAKEREDGSLVALKIYVEREHDDDDDHEDTFAMGEVTAITTDTITVGTMTFSITVDTHIHGEIAVGVDVNVRGYITPEGAMIAEKIRVVEEHDHRHHVVIVGAITAVTDTSITIERDVVQLTPDTVVEGTLEEGAYAIVKATEGEDDELVANTIVIIERPSQEGHRIRERGEVEAVTDDSVTINGVQFMITDETRIRSEDAIVVGDMAAARGRKSAEGTVNAHWIKVLDGDDPSGEIDSISGTELVVSGVSYEITPDTFIDGNLVVGTRVEFSQSENSRLAGVEYIGVVELVPTAVTVSNITTSASFASMSAATLIATFALAGLAVTAVKRD